VCEWKAAAEPCLGAIGLFELRNTLFLGRVFDVLYKHRLSPAAHWQFLLWETSWRGMSTVQQTSIPALHVQMLTVKWWVSLPEWLRFGSAAPLLRVLSSCVENLLRFWQSVVERMKPYEFYFLDPRLVSIDWQAREHGRSP
jgi:hypothetical protein